MQLENRLLNWKNYIYEKVNPCSLKSHPPGKVPNRRDNGNESQCDTQTHAIIQEHKIYVFSYKKLEKYCSLLKKKTYKKW